MKKAEYSTITIMEGVHCRDCGWPIIDVCCNGSFAMFKDANRWDWWEYCSNKTCKHHEGQGIDQDRPEWIESDQVTQ